MLVRRSKEHAYGCYLMLTCHLLVAWTTVVLPLRLVASCEGDVLACFTCGGQRNCGWQAEGLVHAQSEESSSPAGHVYALCVVVHDKCFWKYALNATPAHMIKLKKEKVVHFLQIKGLKHVSSSSRWYQHKAFYSSTRLLRAAFTSCRWLIIAAWRI